MESEAAVVQISDAARAYAMQRAEPALEESVVEARIAQHEVAANVSSMQSSDDMMRELLAVLGRR